MPTSNNNIIPWTLPVNIETTTTIPRAEEWAWDFDNYEFKFNSAGQMYKVYENEAIKIWIWKLFKTWRWHEIVHSDAYGSDIWSLIGKGFSKGFTESEARRIAKEAIEDNLGRYITSIGAIEVSLEHGKLKLKIPITTIYSQREEVMEIGV